MFICIDESGDLGTYPPSNSPYYVIAALVTDKQQSLQNIVKRFRKKQNLKKKNEKLPAEIKFSALKTRQRILLLDKIAECPCSIYSYVLQKNAGTECRNKEALDIYLDGMEELIRAIAYDYPEESEYIIYIDKGPASQLGFVLDEKICAILKSDKTTTIEIKRMDSQNAEEIQEADLVAGAIHWEYREKYLRGEENTGIYLTRIENIVCKVIEKILHIRYIH